MFGQSLLSAFGSAACTTDTDQLFTTDVQTTSVATYQLNNATTSIPSNTYPGTPSNITYAAGKFGNAAVFNGSSSYISADNPFAGQSGASQEYSVSIWFKADSFTNTTYPTLFKGFNTSNNGQTPPFVWTNGSIIRFHGYTYADASVSLSTGVWYHLVVIENNSTIQIYLNGVLQSLNASTTWNQVNGNKILFGGDTASMNNTAFDGQIDQVRIFNSVLPQSAVTALYNETTTTATYDYVEYEGANPNSIAYYKMSDATDQLGNYNGTATNVNFNTEGKFGFAGAFNGSSSYINTNYTKSGTAFSFSCWVNLNDTSSRHYIFGDFNSGGSDSSCSAYLQVTAGDDLILGVGNGSSPTSSITLIDGMVGHYGVWTHLGITINGTSGIIYRNGTPVKTGTFSFSMANGQNPLALGIYSTAAGAGELNGSIDQIRIYDSAISAANVTTLYNEIECPAVAVTNAFNTVLYTGNGTNLTVTGVGFQPDWVWIKSRSNVREHILCDSVRGVNKELSSDNTYFEESRGVNSFDTNGFTLDGLSANYNSNNESYVAWNWKAGGAAVANTDGTVTTQVSANVDAGFSIVKYTGNGGNATLGSGLDQQVEMVICKSTESVSQWMTYHKDLTGNVSGDNPYNLYLNGTDAQLDLTAFGAYNSFTSSVFPVTRQSAATAHNNNLNIDYIAYCFTSIPGYSKVGSYVGNGSATGPVVYLGFEPAFVMVKNTTGTGLWLMSDNKRQTAATKTTYLQAQSSDAEYSPYTWIEYLSNGFQLKNIGSSLNTNGSTYIFIAFAE